MVYHTPSTPSFISCAAERMAVEQWISPEITRLLPRSDVFAKRTANMTTPQIIPLPMAMSSPYCGMYSPPRTLMTKTTHTIKYSGLESLCRESKRFSKRKPTAEKRSSPASMNLGRKSIRGRPYGRRTAQMRLSASLTQLTPSARMGEG